MIMLCTVHVLHFHFFLKPSWQTLFIQDCYIIFQEILRRYILYDEIYRIDIFFYDRKFGVFAPTFVCNCDFISSFLTL